MGNIFPSIGHAEQYFVDYIKKPLRSLVTPPPPPSSASQPSDPHTATQQSSQQQRDTLAQLRTDAATHVGTQGLIDDAHSETADGSSSSSEQYKRHVHLDTAPPDPRFIGHPDQSHYCWALYNSYLKCMDKRGVLDGHCLYMKKCAVAMCPVDWINDWTTERKAGRWYGVPVPYHKGEMDLSELEDELAAEQAADEEKRKQPDAGTVETERIEEKLVESTEPVEDVTQSGEPVGQSEEVVPAAGDSVPVESNDEAAAEEAVTDDGRALYEPERRETPALWEPQQEVGRAKQCEAEQRKRQVRDMKIIVHHAMGAIHK